MRTLRHTSPRPTSSTPSTLCKYSPPPPCAHSLKQAELSSPAGVCPASSFGLTLWAARSKQRAVRPGIPSGWHRCRVASVREQTEYTAKVYPEFHGKTLAQLTRMAGGTSPLRLCHGRTRRRGFSTRDRVE